MYTFQFMFCTAVGITNGGGRNEVMNNIKCGIYCVYVPQYLTVGFLRHSAQYSHYFIRQLSAATCCQFTVLTWPTVPTARCCGKVTAESDGRWLRDRIVLTGVCVCVCVEGALVTVCSFIGHKSIWYNFVDTSLFAKFSN
jgi:hypothetical protein